MIAASAPAADPVPLTGSSPPTGRPPSFRPVATSPAAMSAGARRADVLPQHPFGLAPVSPEPDVADLADRTTILIRRERSLSGRLDRMPPTDELLGERFRLDRVWSRMVRRIGRRVRRLSRTRSPTIRAVGLKGCAYIEMATAGRREDPDRDRLGLSIARDAFNLALAAACRPEETTSAEPDALALAAEQVAALARREWAALSLTMATDERRAARPTPRAEIARRAADRLCGRMNRRLRAGCRALARRPATTPAALAAKAQAVLAVENATDSDGWWVALRDAVVRDAAALRPAPADAAQRAEPDEQDGPMSIEQAAAVDFGPFAFDGWLPPSTAEWNGLGETVLVTMRIAYQLLLKDKAKAVALMADLARVPSTELNDEHLFERIDGALALFETFTAVLTQARLRCLYAAAAVALQGEAGSAADAARSAA